MVRAKCKTGWLGLVLGLLFCSSLVLADRHERDDSKRHDKEMSLSHLSKLKLSSEQKQEIHSLNETFRNEIERLHSEEFKIKTELKLLWLQPHPDPRRIMSKEKAMHDLEWQMKEKSVQYRLAFRDKLTPEQLSEYLQEGGDYHHRHHED